jgi:thymidylate synthase (FAD)
VFIKKFWQDLAMVAFPKQVELIGVLRHPKNNNWTTDDYPVAGAMGCFAEESSRGIHDKHKVQGVPYETGKGEKKKSLGWNDTRELIMKETSGRGHGAVTDQSLFVYSVDNLTRASTLFLCGPEYADHLQQSLRRVTAERGFLPEGDFDGSRGFAESTGEGNEIMKRQFDLYERMGAAGLSTEDARIILPLNTKTNIHTAWDARELMHLETMASDSRTVAPRDVGDTVRIMYELASEEAPALMKDRKFNMERLSFFPSSQLFYRANAPLERIANEGKGLQLRNFGRGIEMSADEIQAAIENRDEALLSDLKQYHFDFVAPMSLMTFHQATRQRTWNQAVEPLKSAVLRGQYVTPACIRDSPFKAEFEDLFGQSIDYVRKNINNSEAYGVIPHALQVYDAIHVNGWNALHAVGKRTCKTAQWEVRGIAKYMAEKIREVAPELGKHSLPQGILYGTCPERENCGACKKK